MQYLQRPSASFHQWYRIDGLNSVCLEERGEGVRSESDPTRLHLIRRTKRSDKTIRQMLS